MIILEKVSVRECKDYKQKHLLNKVDEVVKDLGGWDSLITPGQKVLLKVNLLMGKDPAEAVTTHPELLRAVAKKVQESGGEVIIGDSPAGPFNSQTLKWAYKKAGYYAVAQAEGFQLNYNVAQKKIEFPAGKLKKSFIISEYVTEADLIINLPKLKTHGLTKYTGAVKNLFGVVPGVLKAEYHLLMQGVDDFSRMLNDLATLIKPELTIMDGIIGMEGEGPSGGNPREFGFLLASRSPFALDAAVIDFLGIEPAEKVPLIKTARQDKLLSVPGYQLIGDQMGKLADVKIPVIEKQSNLIDNKLPDFLANFLEKLLRPRPIFLEEKCVGCKTCAESCPPTAIEMKDNFPEVELAECIRCFCCQELCPYQAVEIKHPFLGKIFFGS